MRLPSHRMILPAKASKAARINFDSEPTSEIFIAGTFDTTRECLFEPNFR